ncbi:MAG TPA: hypothetical protein VF157_12685, partial [Chloroflexota bacterium]
MDRAHPPLSLIKILAGLVFGMMLLATPMAAWAQASGVPPPANSAASQPTAPASPGQTQATSPSPAQAPGGAQSAAPPPSAAASEAPSTSSAQAGASPAPSGPVVRGLPTPVGGNPPQETPEPIPWLAYLLIALAAIWFLWAVRGITRLLGRPRGVPYPPQIPPAERDRPFLSFGMPFLA